MALDPATLDYLHRYAAPAREAYLAAFLQTRGELQQQHGAAVAVEIQARIKARSSLYRDLVRFDTTWRGPNNEPQFGHVLTKPSDGECVVLKTQPDATDQAPYTVAIAPISWGLCNIDADAVSATNQAFTSWFERWFDPADANSRDNKDFAGVIHSVEVLENGPTTRLAVDFGSAPVDSLFELVELLLESGSTSIMVGFDASRSPPQPKRAWWKLWS